MPFDPNLPANNSPIVSAELRNQLNALKALIDAQQVQINSLQTALNGKANRPGNLLPIGTDVNDPPSHDDVEVVINQLNGLLDALKA